MLCIETPPLPPADRSIELYGHLIITPYVVCAIVCETGAPFYFRALIKESLGYLGMERGV